MALQDEDRLALRDHDRVRKVSPIRKSMIRPELGAICGTIAVFAFFVITASGSGMFSAQGVMNWGTEAAQFAIIAVGACLLMISGEFDLSIVGKTLGTAQRGEVDQAELRDLMAGGEEIVELENSLRAAV